MSSISPSGTMTLLFTDLVGSTELMQRLGDDEAENVRRRYFELMRAALERHDGREVKSLGDGLMIAFASSTRALACALELQHAIDEHNAAGDSVQLGLRVGVNVGEVTSEDDDYFGTAVVVARRLCDHAHGGEVLVSGIVHNVVGSRGGFEFRELGPIGLKGLADPLPVYELLWRRHEGKADDRIAAAPESDAPGPPIPLPIALRTDEAMELAGRERELRQLTECFETSIASGRQVALIAGEPGIGKSRLSAELARFAHAAGAVALYGRCDEESLVPFQPFLEAVRHYLSHCSDGELRRHLRHGSSELAVWIPDLQRRLPDLPTPPRSEGDSDRYRLFEAVTSWISAIAEQAPVVLVLDDVHWADRSTLILLRHLIRSLEESRVTIAVTYRDVELHRSHPLSETLAELWRSAGVTRLALRGVSEQSVADLIRSWARQEPPDELVALVWRETEGHPFFVQEMLRHLLETGAIYADEGAIGVRSLEGIGLPEGVKEVIERRIDQLRERAMSVLRAASVIGRDFDLGLLEEVSECSEDELLEIIEEATAARLLVENSGGPGSYRFSHALVRQVLYEDMSGTRRARLHVRIGQALEASVDRGETARLSELAHHFFEASTAAGYLDKAIDYAASAAMHAHEQLAYEEAVSLFQRALDGLTLRGGDPSRRCQLLLAQEKSLWNAGEFRRARDTLEESARIADELGLAEPLAIAAIRFGGRMGFRMGLVDPALVSMLNRALERLPEDDSALRAQAMVRLAGAQMLVEDRHRRAELCAEAVAMSRRLDDPALLAEVLLDAAVAQWGPSDLQDRLASAAELIPLAIESGNIALALEARVCHTSWLLEAGRLAEADAEIRASEEAAADIRQPYHRFLVELVRTLRMLWSGRVNEAVEMAQQMLFLGQQGQNPSATQVFSGHALAIYALQGRCAELHAGSQGFADHFEEMPILRCGLALTYCEMGLMGEARAQLDRLAARVLPTPPEDLFTLGTLCLLAEVCGALSDRDHAERIVPLLEPYADRIVILGGFASPYGSARRALGVLASVLGHQGDAQAHFEAAIATNTALEMPVLAAETQLAYARMLTTRGQPGDRERTSELLAQVAEVARAERLSGLLAKVDALRAPEQGNRAHQRLRTRDVALRLGDDARSKMSLKGRSMMAKYFGDASDDELERRFGSPIAQRALMTGMARSLQPRFTYGFEGEIAVELIASTPGEGPESHWWTLEVSGRKAVARRRAAPDAAATLHMRLPDFVRVMSGDLNPVSIWIERNVLLEGDPILAARMVEMFGGVAPFKQIASAHAA